MLSVRSVISAAAGLCILALLFALPLPSSAASFGISPSRVITALLPETSAIESFSLSRSNTDTAQSFLISVQEGGEYIHILGDSIVTMDIGHGSIQVPISIDSSGLELGEHEGLVAFEPIYGDIDDEGTLRLEVTILGRVEFSVSETLPDFYAAVDFEELVESVGVFEATNFDADAKEYVVNDTGDFEWNFVNSGDIPVYNLPYDISISKDGHAFYQTSSRLSDFISPGSEEQLQFSYTFLEPGEYVVGLTAFGNQEQIAVYVRSDSFIQEYSNWIVSVGIGVVIVGLLVLILSKVRVRGRLNIQSAVSLDAIGILFIVVLLFSAGLYVVWYFSQPKAEFVDQLPTALQGALVFHENDGGNQSTVVFSLVTFRGEALEGKWNIMAATDDRFYAVPFTGEGQYFYLITPTERYTYTSEELPGKITSISENQQQTHMLIQGISTDEDKAYYCIASLDFVGKVQCEYVNAYLPNGTDIDSVEWASDLQSYAYAQTPNALFRINPDNMGVEQLSVDATIDSNEGYVQVSTILDSTYTTNKILSSYYFAQSGKRYRIANSDLYKLEDDFFLVERVVDETVYYSMFSVLSGQHQSLHISNVVEDIFYIGAGETAFSE